MTTITDVFVPDGVSQVNVQVKTITDVLLYELMIHEKKKKILDNY